MRSNHKTASDDDNPACKALRGITTITNNEGKRSGYEEESNKSESETETDGAQSDSEGDDEESPNTSNYPNPMNLKGYDLKRARKMTQNGEYLLRAGTYSKEDYAREFARAWKLPDNGGYAKPSRTKIRPKANEDTTPVTVRRSSRRSKRPAEVTVRRSSRQTKRPAMFVPAPEKRQRGGTQPNMSSGDRTSPFLAASTQNTLWSPEEHDLFIEGLQLYGGTEEEGNKRWKKIAFHVETKNSQQVRAHGAKPYNTGTWSPEELARYEKAVELYGKTGQSADWKAGVISSVVHTRSSTQCIAKIRKHGAETDTQHSNS